jgi:hypothetical protein
MVLCAVTVGDQRLQLGAPSQRQAVRGLQHVLGEHTGLDALGELDLLRGGQQRGLADTIEVHPDQIGRGSLSVQVGGLGDLWLALLWDRHPAPLPLLLAGWCAPASHTFENVHRSRFVPDFHPG